jgi:LmbE family N-acetylglucosaminyl deacetylase
MFAFSQLDRVLFVAPHPDDESLGGGGLLQRTFAAQVPIRVLFATNGDNNPWAQRFWERRWRIGSKERVRWGQRRQREALAAIDSLGGSVECARFLNFQDQSLTSLLMQADPELFEVLADEIRAFDPTILVIPTILDAHPDHSALGVALSFVLDLIGNSGIQVWEYLVHRPQVSIPRRPVRLRLSPIEIERKRSAILCHETQVALSRKRFLQYAKAEEGFYANAGIGVASDARPIPKAHISEDDLNLLISARRRERLGAEVLLAFRSKGIEMHCWRIKVSIFSGVAQIRDAISGKRLHDAVATWNGSSLNLKVPIARVPGVDALFMKLSSRTLFFDRSGWYQVPVASGRSLMKTPSVPNLLTLL